MAHRSGLLLFVLGTFLALALSFEDARTIAQDKTKSPEKSTENEKPRGNKKIAMQAFMRKKLEASQSVLEGLALEDFDLIARAKQLKTTSAAAEFIVIHDPLYTEYADEFRRIVDKMEKSAKEKRIDGATLAYVDMTMSCVECHKYVRNILVAK